MTDPLLYDRIGTGYTAMRREEPRWAAVIHAALGDGRRVLNVGAGTGSYEPSDREVVAVDPSLVMLSQRPPNAAPSVRAVAEALPFRERTFDTTMAILTVHHWRDWRLGAAEMRRVTGQRIVVLTAEIHVPGLTFWLTSDYFPEITEHDRVTMPTMDELAGELNGARVERLLVPHDCSDGFLGAYWRRPAAYLDPAVRAGISGFSNIPTAAVERGVHRLADDLQNGTWEQRYGGLLGLDEIDLGYRLVVADY
jgi:SAM-dependent methyltransferase